ncbi:MAG: RidA family protein [Verrucomicrobiota bacterium]
MKKNSALCSLSLLLVLAATGFGMSPEERLSDLGLTLPEVAPAVANYVPVVRTGNLVFLAGHLPRHEDRSVVTGRVGESVNPEEANDAARQTALELLATLRAEVGDLSKVRRIVRVEGYINSTDDFTGQSGVMNGCSDLLVEVFGEAGRHARLAIGVNTLPLGAVLEIALVAEVD